MLLKISINKNYGVVINSIVFREYIHYTYSRSPRNHPLAYEICKPYLNIKEAEVEASKNFDTFYNDVACGIEHMCLEAIRGTPESFFSKRYSERQLNRKNVSKALLKHYKLKGCYSLDEVASMCGIGSIRLAYWLRSRKVAVSWFYDGISSKFTAEGACYVISLVKAYRLHPQILYTL